MNWITIITAFVIWNTIVFTLYGLDKHNAKCGGQRIRESALLFVAALMGSLGALLGMYVFRHKTKHTKFKIGVPLLLVVNILIIAVITYYKIYY